MYKVIGKEHVNSGEKYLREIASINQKESLWGAIKSKEQVDIVTVNGISGYALNGEVFVLKDTSWNDLQGLSRLQGEVLGEPIFPVMAATEVRMGFLQEVLKKGYIVFPLTPLHDMKNRPIVVRK